MARISEFAVWVINTLMEMSVSEFILLCAFYGVILGIINVVYYGTR